MERRVYDAQEYDFEDDEFYLPHELSKKEKAERMLLVATLLIAALIIICMSLLVVVLVILDPYEVASSLEQEGYVDIAGLLRQAAEIMSGKVPME